MIFIRKIRRCSCQIPSIVDYKLNTLVLPYQISRLHGANMIWIAIWITIPEDVPIYTGYSLFHTTKRITLLFIVQSLLNCNPPNIWI